MQPNKAEIAKWVRVAGWSPVGTTENKYAGYLVKLTTFAQIEIFATLAYAAGEQAGLERAAEVCEQIAVAYDHDEAVSPDETSSAARAAAQCAIAIRALKGEKNETT